MPSQATLYRLVTTLARPGELPSGPVRQVPASVEGRAFTPAVALRPGEQVQIDTTRLDVLALFDDGRLARPELTIAVDVATRAILAAVLCPSATKAVDAALLLAEMAVPHPARPTWPDILRMDHARALPHQRLATLDERLAGAAARPVVLPETIVVDRGKIFVSRAFTAACESLGISVQPAPPRAPTAKGIVERTFGSINALFCQHLPGYTGSDVTRRGPDTEKDACYSVAQMQDLLDEWLVHYHHRPHEGLRHPMMPRKALTPNEMWAALVAVAGYVPVPLTGRDYLELLPVRWQAITPAGISIHHRTYDADLLAPHRGQASPVAGRGGKWEIHYNPHDVRQIWVRLPDGELTEIPWIHRDHVHRPFDERTWQHIRTQAVDGNHGDAEQHEASLADALDQLMRRVHSGHATTTEQALMARTAHLPLPEARDGEHGTEAPAGSPTQQGDEGNEGNEGNDGNDGSIDDLDNLPDDDVRPRPGHRIRALQRARGSRHMVNPSQTSASSTPDGPGHSGGAELSWPLTTWQGWNRFATTDPPAPSRPGAPLRSTEERLAYHSAFVTIRTPAIHTLATQVRTLMILGRHQQTTARPSLIVTGPARSRETTALLNVGRTCHLAHTRKNPPLASFTFSNSVCSLVSAAVGDQQARRCSREMTALTLRSVKIAVRSSRPGLTLRAWMKSAFPRPSCLRSSRVSYWGIRLMLGC
ncbi:Mu transposase C-terminal domain-containing protein [Streptomyces sp. S1A(2023)]